MRLLVTGAGRCGTWWLTHALRSCGVPARHEVAYSTDRHGDRVWECEVSWLAAPYTPVSENTYVVHLVRHPLRQIASRAAWGSFEDREPAGWYDPRPKGRWAMRMCPEIAGGATPIERAAIHWVAWNSLVVSPQEVLRLEDLDAATVWRLARIVRPGAEAPTMPRPTNQSVNPPSIEWADVDHLAGLVDLAESYGYPR